MSRDYRVDALIYGDNARWNKPSSIGTPTEITFSFMRELPAYFSNYPFADFRQPSDAIQQAVRQALHQWEAVAGLHFVEVSDSGSGGVLRIGTYAGRTNFQGPNDGEGFPPNSSAGVAGDLFLNHTSAKLNTLTPGSSGYAVIVHEIGHALGLKHPGSYSSFDQAPFLPTSEDTSQNTIMSYNGSATPATGPGPYDALALNYLYGSPQGQAAQYFLAGGTTGNDTLTGTGFNEILFGDSGNDALVGGSGTDTALYVGARAQYTIARTGDTIRVSGPEGSDTLTGIERLRFSDGTLALDAAGDTSGQAYRLYQASLGRSPDNVGLGYQTNRLDQGTSLENVAAGFIASPEFEAKYGALSNAAYVGQLYQNVLGRTAGASEIAYHVSRLEQGVSRQGILVGFSESPEFIANTAALTPNGIWFS